MVWEVLVQDKAASYFGPLVRTPYGNGREHMSEQTAHIVSQEGERERERKREGDGFGPTTPFKGISPTTYEFPSRPWLFKVLSTHLTILSL